MQVELWSLFREDKRKKGATYLQFYFFFSWVFKPQMLLLGIRILNWRAHFFNQVSIKRRWVWSLVLETLTLSFDIKACENGKVSWDKGKKWEEKLSMGETEKEVIKVSWYWVSEPVEISLNCISDILLNEDASQSPSWGEQTSVLSP